MLANTCCNFGRKKCYQKISSEDSKIQDFAKEIQQMWTVKTKVIPLIPGATGTFSKSFRKCLRNILGRQGIKELQITAILSTTHNLWKVLMQKYKKFYMGNNITCTICCNHRIAAVLYTLETWVVSGT